MFGSSSDPADLFAGGGGGEGGGGGGALFGDDSEESWMTASAKKNSSSGTQAILSVCLQKHFVNGMLTHSFTSTNSFTENTELCTRFI